MRFHYLLPLAAFGSALVLPDEQVFNELSVESRHKADSVLDQLYATKDKAIEFLSSSFQHEIRTNDQLFDDAVSQYDGDNEFLLTSLDDESVAARALLQYAAEPEFDVTDDEHRPPPPPKGPPHHRIPGRGPAPPKGPPPKGPAPPKGPPHHGPPGRGKRPHRPHHPPHHHKPNQTIYELISKSKYTTKLAELISDDKDLIKLLNSTKANHTIFAPTDYAFSKIPEHAPKPSKEVLKAILTYHVAPGLFPAGRVLYDKTVPSLLEVEGLGGPQRIAARVGLRGVTLNFYSRIIAVNIPATNGIIHGIDSLLLPPPNTLKILNLVPTEFSTLLYALEKTGLVNSSSDVTTFSHHVGGTFFAPSNNAFRKLGPRINAFLFSPAGTKYLKALILYHVVLNQTVYSTAYYNGTEKESTSFSQALKKKGCHHKNKDMDAEANPYVHFDLPTLLYGRTLAIDIGRYGPFVEIKINAFNRVAVADGVARDGVIHLPERVLIPPKQLSEPSTLSHWTGEELTVDDFKARLSPYLEDDEYLVEDYNVEL